MPSLAPLYHLLNLYPALTSLFIAPLVALLLDLITGVARAVRQQKFDFYYFGDFAGGPLGRYLGLLIAGLALAVTTQQGIDGAVAVTQTMLAPWYLAQIASIDNNIALLTGGDQGFISRVVDSFLHGLFGKNEPVDPEGGLNEEGAVSMDTANTTSTTDATNTVGTTNATDATATTQNEA